jgi:acetoin utilization deacetylase AcuC-like enzyme
MKVVHSQTHVVHNPRWEFTRGRRIYSKDIPSRATLIREALERSTMAIEFVPPDAYPEDLIAETHAYFEFIRDAARTLGPDEIIYPDVFPVRRKARRPSHHAALAGYYCYDTGTPLTRHAFVAAKAAADIALTAAALLPAEKAVYALCRPPGHHAEREVFGGYCYFNNPAIAAKRLAQLGPVAVLDIDYHHGNGTQDIFYDTDRVLTVSIHGDPETVYPYFSGHADELGEGEGYGANLNLPLAPGSSVETFLAALDEALRRINDYAPWALVLAVGFDTCKGDPAGSFDLSTKHYPIIARRIAALGLPTLIVQEGGYSTERLGRNAVAFLQAYDEAIRG